MYPAANLIGEIFNIKARMSEFDVLGFRYLV